MISQVKARPEVSSLTTPSANKSVSRNRSKMACELFALFNKTVFNNKVSTVNVNYKLISNRFIVYFAVA